MCTVKTLFTQQGFDVVSVNRSLKTPLVLVRDIPRNYRIKKEASTCTDNLGAEYRMGTWFGCHVAVIQ